ncbi:MAG: SIS domain-containing protein, partial [Acidobacteriota bacterium]
MRQYLDELKSILDGIHPSEVERVCDILYRAYQQGRTVFVFGNGGSAAMASHIVGDWAKETVAAESAKPFKVLSL